MPRNVSSTKLQKLTKIFILFILGIAVMLFVLIAVDGKFRVRTIRLEGVIKGTQIYGLDGIYNESTIFLDENKTAELLKKSNPPVSNIIISKNYPDTLTMKFSFYHPAVYLAADTGYLLLSQDGRVLSRSTKIDFPAVPTISYYQKISYEATQPGSYLAMKDILMAIYFSEKASALGLQVNTIDIDGVDMIGLNLDGKVIVFSSEKEKEFQVYQMEQIVHQFRIQGKNFTKMDLRFNKPVLELSQ